LDQAGQFFLLGGFGVDANGALGALNDRWQYAPASGTWQWLGGSSTVNAPGVYSMSTGDTTPGSRFGAALWFDAPSGLTWLFGGTGFDGQGNEGLLNDLWRLTP
jgi:hypothetical protein